jgi:uncharacterized Rmd1/YagE family protein
LSRSTQKEVLLPENAVTLDESSEDEECSTEQQQVLVKISPPQARPRKSFAERLAKSQRDESMLPRVTGYCICEAYKLQTTQSFLVTQHEVLGAEIYDEALYARYQLPLQNGQYGFRIKSGRPNSREDGSREYSSDSETQVKKDREEESVVGSSAMLGEQSYEEGLFSPSRKNSVEGLKVHFLEPERGGDEVRAGRPLKRRDSSEGDLNPLKHLAECNSRQ